jgi:uncharacterized protein
MTAAIAYRGRLPGVRCEPALPPAVDDAIRLDVAAFVGFAERGPVDLAVAVEDPGQYEAIFGGDLPLALDEHGVPTYAALPTAVRTFFDCGGRRAKVVRVVGDGARVRTMPVRVVSRRPLGGGLAFTGLRVAGWPDPWPLGPVLDVLAASPGGWARAIGVDATLVDEVLALETLPGGEVRLTDASVRALEPGDVLVVSDGPAGGWYLLVDDPTDLPHAATAIAWSAPSPIVAGSVVLGDAPPVLAWPPSAVVRRIRVDLTVRRADAGTATIVERLVDLRLGPDPATGTTRTRSWMAALQADDGSFDRERSAYLRAPGGQWLIPMLGAVLDDVELDPPSTPVEPFTAEALADDDLVTYEHRALFADGSLLGHTVDGLRLALAVLELEHDPHPHGIHAIALDPEVAILAVPDAYHLSWTEQAVLMPPPDVVAPPPPAVVPLGFHGCDQPELEASPPVELPPPPAVLRLVLDPAPTYEPAPLRDLLAAIVHLCAARADLVAAVALPRHATLTEAHRILDPVTTRPAAGTDALSYVGVWHPWPSIVEERSPAPAPLRAVPPDGAVCGTIAATERDRGVWIEPAGRVLRGAVAIDPDDASAQLALFDAGFNVVRHRPGGFVATSAHTLSADRSLLQLSVRRLLIWIRKLALREGNRLVFAADDERFRAQVGALFRRHLAGLQRAGALVAFEVVVADVSTAIGPDEGRVRIDLKVAPTSPIEFLTVSLVRAGDGLLQAGGA